MQLKKGSSITDNSGTTYTLTGLNIKNQIVKHTISLPGHEPIPGEMPINRWKELAATANSLDTAGIVNKLSQPQHPIINKGMHFQMMDRSSWKIWEYNRFTKKLLAINEKTKTPQDFTLDEFTALVNDGHIKILS